MDAAMKYDAVERSRLERVVAIGRALAREEVSVEVLALEIRTAGSLLHWRAKAPPDAQVRLPEFAVSADVDERYQVFVARWTSSEGMAQGEAVIVPAPRQGSTRLRIRISLHSGPGHEVLLSDIVEVDLR
ncbi:MAG: hypothetical protein AABZ33_07375 [Chloroflexota bacterium]